MIINKSNEAIRLVFIAFLPHERNQGYGRRLIQALQSEAAAPNKALTLSVNPLNTTAKHLYLSSGFQIGNGDDANMES